MKKTIVLVLAAVMVLGVAGAAFADNSGPISGVGSPLAASGTVTINAKVNPKLTLTLDTPDSPGLLLNWVIDPDVAPAGKAVSILVDSNKQFDLAVTEDFTGFAGSGITVSNSLAAGETNIGKGKGVSRTDNVSLSSSDWWQVDPDPTYAGTILYTVTQD
jgi:hypothetical protein